MIHENKFKQDKFTNLNAFRVQVYRKLHRGSDLEKYIDWDMCNRRQ